MDAISLFGDDFNIEKEEFIYAFYCLVFFAVCYINNSHYSYYYLL